MMNRITLQGLVPAFAVLAVTVPSVLPSALAADASAPAAAPASASTAGSTAASTAASTTAPAVTVVGSTTSGSPATRSVRLTQPPGTGPGDLLLASFTTDQAPSVTVPSGWRAVVAPQSAEGQAKLHTYYRSASSSVPEPDVWTFGLASSVKWNGGVTAYRGVDLAQPLDAAATTVAKSERGNTITAPGLTTRTPGAMLVGGVGLNSSSRTVTPPTSMTEAWESIGQQSTELAHKGIAAAGPVGGKTWRFEAGAQAVAWLAALRPAAGTPTVSTERVLAAAGDIACGTGTPSDASCDHGAVSDAILADDVDAVLALGDIQYEDGTLADFRRYFDPTWGRFKSRIRPVVGNHEYRTSNAQGYRDYFGSAVGGSGLYYSFDLGGWHVVVLNSERDLGSDGAQLRWLRADLAAHPNRCVAAAWHRPRWSTGNHGNDDRTAPFVRALYDAGAELVLSGHDHGYERFVPRDPSGARDDARGLVQIVSGAGGKNHRPVAGGSHTAVKDATSSGYSRLVLRPGSADITFRSAVGSFRDSTRIDCR